MDPNSQEPKQTDRSKQNQFRKVEHTITNSSFKKNKKKTKMERNENKP